MTTERIVRECGERIAGGIYICTEPAPPGQGRELEAFIVDPPVQVDMTELGISDVGQYLVPAQGGEVWHIFDVVGQDHYPNPCDALEEIRAVGLSRRASPTLEYGKLDYRSRIYLLHRRGLFSPDDRWYTDAPPVGNRNQGGDENERVLAAAGYRSNAGPRFRTDREAQSVYCPRWIATGKLHDRGEFCAGLWWENMDPKTPGFGLTLDPNHPYRAAVRQLACGRTYNAARPPDDVVVEYETAIIASFPIHKITVIRDAAGGTHVDRVKKAKESRGLPVVEEDF